MIASGIGWEMRLGDCDDILPLLDPVDHTITDPPYGEEFHKKSRTQGNDGMTRVADYGFEGLAPQQRIDLGVQFARLTKRWVLAFSDPESSHLWRQSLEAADMRYCRRGVWIKLACTPQFNGDRPASGHEEISIAYAKCSGRTRWNGGGGRAVWTHPVVNIHHDREHTTQKPVPLMLELVQQFTDPGELVLDPFAGSGTTGIACVRLGRRFVGIERDEKYFKLACDRLRAEEQSSTLQALRAGQESLFK